VTNHDFSTRVTLPTAALIGAASVAAITAGAAWALFAFVFGQGMSGALVGLAAGGLVAVSATLGLCAIMPWRPRQLGQWPAVWVAGSFLRMAITLGGTFLLYSATPFGGRTLWFAVMVAYLAAMAGETRVYALSMRRFTPSPGPSAAAPDASPGPPDGA